MPLSVRPCGVWMAALMNGPTSAWFQRSVRPVPLDLFGHGLHRGRRRSGFPRLAKRAQRAAKRQHSGKKFALGKGCELHGQMLPKRSGMSSERKAGLETGRTAVWFSDIIFTAVYVPVADAGYVAWLEEMPGVQTQGETLAEAKENLLDAFNPSLEYLRDKAIGCD